MDEVGSGVVADAAVLQAHGDGAHAAHVDIGQAEIHGLAGHVLAVLRDAARSPPQHGIGLGGPVGREDVDRFPGADLPVDFPDDVEQARVHLGGLVDPPIAQEPIDLVQRVLVVAAVAPEGDGRGLVRVRMQEAQGAGVAVGDGILGAANAGERREGRDGDADGGAAGPQARHPSMAVRRNLQKRPRPSITMRPDRIDQDA